MQLTLCCVVLAVNMGCRLPQGLRGEVGSDQHGPFMLKECGRPAPSHKAPQGAWSEVAFRPWATRNTRAQGAIHPALYAPPQPKLLCVTFPELRDASYGALLTCCHSPLVLRTSIIIHYCPQDPEKFSKSFWTRYSQHSLPISYTCWAAGRNLPSTH